MTNKTIDVHIRHTGEIINVPISPRSTIKDIIKYVCGASVMKAKFDYHDYYLVLNDSEMLENDKTVEEINAFTLENPQWQLRKKTAIRRHLFDVCLNSLRTVGDSKVSKTQTSVNATQFRQIPKTDEKPGLIKMPADVPKEIISNKITTSVDNKRKPPPPIPPKPSNPPKINTDKIIPQNTVSPRIQSKFTIDEKVKRPGASPNGELKSQSTEIISSSNVQSSTLTGNLADTYHHVISQIDKIGETATRDPVTRRDISNAFREINIILCGSARVGKSSLINAICQRAVAKTSPGLDACTSMMSRYYLEGTIENDAGTINYRYNFWDTPGFESWNQEDISKRLETILSKPKSDILCMIYCASPGSYANLQQLGWLLKECTEKQIFCALVCTNKWGGQKIQRDAIMDDFQRLLVKLHPKTREENGVFYFGNVGLCTAVNSTRYEDPDVGKTFDQSGINELIFGIMESLDEEKIGQWCLLAFENKPFWKSIFNFPKQLTSFFNKLRRKN